jgi:hypothetical protein
VPHQSHALARRDVEGEAAQHLLLVRVLEDGVLEADLAAQLGHWPVVDLLHRRFGVDQGENALRRRKPCLELAPEGGDVDHGKPETIQAEDEEVPIADRDVAAANHPPTPIDEHRRSHARQRVKQGKDRGHGEPPAQVDLVRALVDPGELIIDRRLLTKVLGHANAGHCFLDGGIDLSYDLESPPGDLAGDAAESQGQQNYQGSKCQHHQCHTPRDIEQGDQHNADQHQLAEQIGDELDDLGELLGVGRDAADNASRLELVKERHVVTHRGLEGIAAQCQHDRADDAGYQAAA